MNFGSIDSGSTPDRTTSFKKKYTGEKKMEFDNKTIIITGLVIGSITAMFLNYEQIALAIVAGLVGYLSKDANITLNRINTEEDENDEGI